VPGVFLVTTQFKDAAAIQSKALGFDPGILWMPHPIQNRTADELKKLAEDAVPGILEMITSVGKKLS
jgi:hypothetical protein